MAEGMEAHHAPQPYDVPSSQQPVDGESLWTPSGNALVVAAAPPERGQALATNVHGIERIASSLVGGLLLARGVSADGPVNRLLALVGSALVFRGISGHCHLYQALGIDTAHQH